MPVYNESNNIAPLIEAVEEALKGRDYEIIVVDDNSSDGTFKAAAAKSNALVRVFSRRQNRSLAASIRDGLMCAEGEYIVVMDSDFNHRPEYLPFMLDVLSGYDCVVASRFLSGGGMDNQARYCLSAIFNFFLRRFTSLKVSDSLYGFFAVKKNILRGCRYDDIFYGHGDYCMRLFYAFQKTNAHFFEFPAVNGRRKSGRRKMGFLLMLWRYILSAGALRRTGGEGAS